MSAAALVVPNSMDASVYRGSSRLCLEQLPVPEIESGELLVRVESCGICHTDLKKIKYDLLPPPRIYGHETAGVVVRTGERVQGLAPGDRVCLFHHIPCFNCFYCRHDNFAQCETYKKVGVGAGFEPAGGGFAQYVKVMDWIVKRGVIKIPEGVSFDRASFVEPVNTCLKALRKCATSREETVLVVGQGPIGLLFTILLSHSGVKNIFSTDILRTRVEASLRMGAVESWSPLVQDISSEIKRVTSGRGADVVIVAASAPNIVEQAVDASRPGGRIMLFAQTSHQETFTLPGALICAQERMVFGSYSAAIDLQEEAAKIVWQNGFPEEELISHRLPLGDLEHGIELAHSPTSGSLKLVVHPQN